MALHPIYYRNPYNNYEYEEYSYKIYKDNNGDIHAVDKDGKEHPEWIKI